MENIVGKIREHMAAIAGPVRLMEVCGTHTVAIFRHGIRNILPEGISLLSGPGCPVCVTSIRDVDTAIAISRTKDVILTTFGDMMRVPGESNSLLEARAEGSDIRIVYSPLDALRLAEENKDKKVVFFATGFETTSPSVAGTVLEAERRGVPNFYIYSVHKTVPPALAALLSSGDVRVDGFILPGHVSTIIGSRPYDFLVTDYRKPSVITGFDGPDILTGIMMLLAQIASGRPSVGIQYDKVVKPEGNPRAIAILADLFEPEDAYWRGIGMIPGSGLKLRERYSHRDIRTVLSLDVPAGKEPPACSCGEILKGIKMPYECLLFGKACTPERPVGACMVSTEGSCSAYYKYKAVFGREEK
ncbi:MAG: hydrogenase formation protein HypD [Nitrospirae bacterium]|nr:MAG: hydrogenase formation protein HypD [Nitrospirota bacterium]